MTRRSAEQRRVHEDGIAGRRQLRLPLALQRLILRVRDVLDGNGKQPRHAVACLAAALERLDRVLERRRFGVGRDRVDLRSLSAKRRRTPPESNPGRI